MPAPRPAAPKLRAFQLPESAELAEGLPGDLRGAGYTELLHFTGDAALDGDGARIEQCLFGPLSPAQFTLRNARLLECVLDAVDTPVLQAAGASLRDVRVTASRFGAADFAEGAWDSVLVEGCRFGWLNLRGARVRDVQFRDCQFDELDLGDAQRVRFTGCSAGSLSVAGAALRAVDLTGLDFAAVDDVSGLRGASIDRIQLSGLAERLAEHLGLRIAN